MTIIAATSKRLYQILLLTTVMLTSACGFHLRGADSLSLSQQPVYVIGIQGNTPALHKLKQALLSAGANVVDSPKDAQYRLTLLKEDVESRTASLDNRARTAEYRIFLRIGFQISDAEGKPITDPLQVAGSQVYAHDIYRIVAANDEAQRVYSELQDKLIRQILMRYQGTIRQLTTTSQAAAADTTTAAPTASEADRETAPPPEQSATPQ